MHKILTINSIKKKLTKTFNRAIGTYIVIIYIHVFVKVDINIDSKTSRPIFTALKSSIRPA